MKVLFVHGALVRDGAWWLVALRPLLAPSPPSTRAYEIANKKYKYRIVPSVRGLNCYRSFEHVRTRV
jgi:hypothetical protein